MVNTMGMYKQIQLLWKNPKEGLGKLYSQRLSLWTQGDATMRIERPTRLDKARALGYRAKPGIFLVRQRVGRSHRMRSKNLRSGRRPKHNRLEKVVDKNYQQIAEERAASKHPNAEVLNSYWVGENGAYKFFEIIFVDRDHPAIKADPALRWIVEKRGRVFRGLTSAGKQSRGLYNKGKGAEKLRPSVNKRQQ